MARKNDDSIRSSDRTSLNKSIQENTLKSTDRSGIEKLQSIAHDCQIIGDFVRSIDLVDLLQIFVNLIPPDFSR
jgi:hypothetical protein